MNILQVFNKIKSRLDIRWDKVQLQVCHSHFISVKSIDKNTPNNSMICIIYSPNVRQQILHYIYFFNTKLKLQLMSPKMKPTAQHMQTVGQHIQIVWHHITANFLIKFPKNPNSVFNTYCKQTCMKTIIQMIIVNQSPSQQIKECVLYTITLQKINDIFQSKQRQKLAYQGPWKLHASVPTIDPFAMQRFMCGDVKNC
eukprot:TRINITY_DN58049_c0_g1_i17.p2 TRINITY_DN58049_c0_g1~~TRINITY_DN58049_c0_g1_i17.p2  ORF type:complete len:198 (-),score=-11.70 TRINITY_DN58049_c0_g1_i17:276-869(-)